MLGEEVGSLNQATTAVFFVLGILSSFVTLVANSSHCFRDGDIFVGLNSTGFEPNGILSFGGVEVVEVEVEVEETGAGEDADPNGEAAATAPEASDEPAICLGARLEYIRRKKSLRIFSI